MIKLISISKSFGSVNVFDQVSIELKPGDVCGLIGPSGSGKSVLLKIMAGVLSQDSGKRLLTGVADHDISIMFQEGALFDSMTVLDNVAFPLVDGRVPAANLPKLEYDEVYPKVESILEQVGLKAALHKIPAQLSGGMRRRVSLARALVTRPKLLLLDDPTAGLDPVASSVIMELISQICASYQPASLIVSHDLRRLFPVVNGLFTLFDKNLKAFDETVALNSAAEHIKKFVACRYDLAA